MKTIFFISLLLSFACTVAESSSHQPSISSNETLTVDTVFEKIPSIPEPEEIEHENVVENERDQEVQKQVEEEVGNIVKISEKPEEQTDIEEELPFEVKVKETTIQLEEEFERENTPSRDSAKATEVSTDKLPDHEAWGRLLKKYVSPEGKVNYKGFKQDKAALLSYLESLSSNSPSSAWNKNEQLAYWINAYNAFTVKLIIDNYPLKSIMDLGKPWDKRFISIGGKQYSLNDIEHNIIRKQFNEARIHFAVNCASQSCPELLNEAFEAGRLNQQLESLTRKFINNPKHNVISSSQAEVSQLFNWYKGDFTKSGSVIDFLNKYSKVKLSPGAKITFRDYDWNLNE